MASGPLRSGGSVDRLVSGVLWRKCFELFAVLVDGIYQMLTSIKGKSVIVTGSSKGIGKGIAKVFAKQGANVLIVARGLDDAEAVVDEITGLGGKASACIADIRKWEDQQRMASTAAERHGGIDILCANAGIFPSASLEEMSVDRWDEVVETNLRGTFLSIKACLPYLKSATAGRVVIISSITGPLTGEAGWAHYGASKAGQLGLMRTAALELAGDGITVNAVLPGNIDTGLHDATDKDRLAAMVASIPLKRLGETEEIGYAALFLASQEAGYITGQTIVVDGGQILPEYPDSG